MIYIYLMTYNFVGLETAARPVCYNPTREQLRDKNTILIFIVLVSEPHLKAQHTKTQMNAGASGNAGGGGVGDRACELARVRNIRVCDENRSLKPQARFRYLLNGRAN